MRWLIGILGLILGIVAGAALLLFNPLMVRGALAPLKADLVPDKSYRMDDYRGMSPDLVSLLRGGTRSGETALAAPALANLRIAIIVLPAGNGRPAALAVKVSTLAEQNALWRARLGTLDYWNLFWPGEGSVFASGYSNYWPMVQDRFLTMLPGANANAEPAYALSAPPPPERWPASAVPLAAMPATLARSAKACCRPPQVNRAGSSRSRPVHRRCAADDAAAAWNSAHRCQRPAMDKGAGQHVIPGTQGKIEPVRCRCQINSGLAKRQPDEFSAVQTAVIFEVEVAIESRVFPVVAECFHYSRPDLFPGAASQPVNRCLARVAGRQIVARRLDADAIPIAGKCRRQTVDAATQAPSRRARIPTCENCGVGSRASTAPLTASCPVRKTRSPSCSDSGGTTGRAGNSVDGARCRNCPCADQQNDARQADCAAPVHLSADIFHSLSSSISFVFCTSV